MSEVETLHHNLFTAIENNYTEESLSIIHSILAYQESNRGIIEKLLDKYSCGTHIPPSPLIHSISKENVIVAKSLLEYGCDPNIRNPSNNKVSNDYCDWFFKVIGKPFFEPVVMTILDASSEVIINRNGDTVLHAICQYKMTSWLQRILLLPSQQHLFHYTNKKGYLPMHVAAKCNFLEYFDLVPIMNDSNDDKVKIRTLFQKHSSGKSLSTRQAEVEMACESSGLGLGKHLSLRDDRKRIQRAKDRNRIADNNHIHPLQSHVCLSKMCKSNDCESGKKTGMDCCMYRFKMDVNVRVVSTGMTALHIAVEHRNSELVKCLIELGAEVTAVDIRNYSPLFACLNSMTSANVERTCPYFVDVCRTLMMAGAQVNGYFCQTPEFPGGIPGRLIKPRKDDCLVTPLHTAAEVGCAEVVQLLLNNGADPKARSRVFGKLPVQFALEKGWTDCAHILLQDSLYPERFLISFVDKSSNSLLHSASNCEEKIINELISNFESCFDKPNLDNVFPLDKALFHGNVLYIRAILSCRPDIVNICHYQQFLTSPPLHRAASSPLGHLPLCQILLSYGANIYAKAYDKRNMAYRRALRLDCYENAVYLCEQMARPFTLAESEELLDYGEKKMSKELDLRLKHRLKNIPHLSSYCLDVIRQSLIENCQSFKFADSLPIPNKLVRDLKYTPRF